MALRVPARHDACVLVTVALVIPLLVALLIPEWWVIALAFVLPVVAYAAGPGSGTEEDWAFIALPIICIVCATITALIVGGRKLLSRRNDRPS